MKLIIEIPEEVYKIGALSLYFNCYSMRLHDTILSGTPIPDNATNGEVIKAVFNEEDIWDIQTALNLHIGTMDWWNAPYQKGGNE